MRKDWLFSDEKTICHFRVAGILIRNGKVFLQKVGTEYAVPGGHVNFGEASEKSLIREFKEEVGIDIVCGRLLWVEEVFWKWDEKNAHGIVFFYLVSLVNDADLPDDYQAASKDNQSVSLQWVPFEDMQKTTVYPAFLKDKIYNLPAHTAHFVRNDWGD